MYPFLCFFLVAGINRIASSTPRLIKIFTIVLAVLTLLIAVLPLLGNLLTKINLERFIHKDKQLTEAKFYVDLISQLHSQWGIIPWVLCLTLLLFSVWLMFSKNKIASGTGSILPPALLIGLCLLFVNTSVLPTITDALSAKPYALKILASTPASIEKFYSYNARYYGLNFYMNGKLEVLEEGAPIPPPALVFVEDSQAENFLKNASNLAITPFARSENPMEKPTIFLKSYLVFPKNKTILHD